MTSGHGVFIFQYCDGESDTAGDEASMQRRAEILQDLAGFKDECIITVSIQVQQHQKDLKITEPKKMTYGFHFCLVVSESKIMHDLKCGVRKVAEKVHSKVPRGSLLRGQIENLVTKLTVLQSMENETNLVHFRVKLGAQLGLFGVKYWIHSTTQADAKLLSSKVQNTESWHWP